MIVKLGRKLQRLDGFLLSAVASDDAMLLSELDGFLAGIAVCPDPILPSEWMPVVWAEEGPEFESPGQAQIVNDLIRGHYNDIVRQLNRGGYRAIYDLDTDDSSLWELWVDGFWSMVLLRPREWLTLGDTDNEDVRHAVFVLSRLHEIATTPSADLEPMEIDEELKDLASDLLPHAVQILHGAGLAQANPFAGPANENSPKVGRNDPCPCGSGKKFKKCCMN